MEIILVEWTNNGVVTILKEISTYTSGGTLDRKYYNSAGVDVTEAVLAKEIVYNCIKDFFCENSVYV